MGRRGVVVALVIAAIGAVVNAGCGRDNEGTPHPVEDAGKGGAAGQRDSGAAGQRDSGVPDRAAPALDAASDGDAGKGSSDAADDRRGDAVDWASYTLSDTTVHMIPEGGLASLHAVAVADVTGDARSDAIVVADGGLFVLAQQANGALGRPEPYPQAFTSGGGYSIAVADLDRSGSLDVVVGQYSGLVVFTSDGSGRLMPGKAFPGQPSDGRLRVMDVDRDGAEDLVAIGSVRPEFVIWYGDGAGGIRELGRFRPGGDYGPGFTDFTLADLTGDGVRDIAALSGNTYPRIHGYAHDATRAFSADELPLTFPTLSVHGIETGDLGRDSRSDLFVTERGGSPGHLWVIRQSATRELLPAEWLYEYQAGDDLVVHDLDRDGDDDVLVKHGGWRTVGVYLQSRGALLPGKTYAIPSANASINHHRVAVGDLSGDGCTDVAVADQNQGLFILHGRDCAN